MISRFFKYVLNFVQPKLDETFTILSANHSQPRAVLAYQKKEDEIHISLQLNSLDKEALQRIASSNHIAMITHSVAHDKWECQFKCDVTDTSFLANVFFDYFKITDLKVIHALGFSTQTYCANRIQQLPLDEILALGKQLLLDNQDLHSCPMICFGKLYEKAKQYAEAFLCYEGCPIKHTRLFRLHRLWDNIKIESDKIKKPADYFPTLADMTWQYPNEALAILAVLNKTEDEYVTKDFFNYYLHRYGLAKAQQLAEKDTIYSSFIHLANACYQNSLISEAKQYFKKAGRLGKTINIDDIPQLYQNRAFLIYGLMSCKYNKIYTLLEAYHYDYFPFHELEIADHTSDKARCKMRISSLIVENYELRLSGQPIIPLLFCVAFSNESKRNQDTVIAKEKIWDVHNHSITSKELRRCYAFLNDMPKEIQEIAKETIKFIKVTQKGKEFHIKEIPCFLSDSDFIQKMQLRKKLKGKSSSSRWKKTFSSEITYVNERMLLFKRRAPKSACATLSFPVKIYSKTSR